MQDFYKPLAERTPDTQYRDRLATILEQGVLAKDTPQGVGALTCFGTLAPMVFDLSNGVPLITERNMPFWKKPVGEMLAFINGARRIDDIVAFGCDYWEDYRGKGTELGLDPDDMGPGSYGAVFHDYERADGTTLNQFAQLLEQIRNYPNIRTFRVTNWRADYTARGPNRKVIVAPCHGDLFFRILDGRLHMDMVQRSADMPIGVPSNMMQYAALLLMLCQVTGYAPGNYVHYLVDAHVYEDQVPQVKKLIAREPRPFPVLRLDPSVTDLFAFRPEHFSIEEYDPLPGMKIPYRP